MKRNIVIFVLVVLLGVCTFYVYSEFNRGHTSLLEEKADFELPATELVHAFQENEAEANDKYLDKILVVSGIIEEIQNEDEQLSLVLGTGDPMSRVVCEMEQLQNGLSEGNNVRVKARCSGFLMDVVLSRGVVLE